MLPFESPGVVLIPVLAAVPVVAIVVIIFYFIHHFITMTTTPFRSMKAIYVYVAALIGLLLLAAGMYGLVGHLIEVLFTEISLNTAFLVTPFTQIVIGLFVMVPHWAIGHHFHLLERKNK